MDWDQIAKDVGRRLYRYFAASFPGFVAADLVQETLLRLWRKVEEGQYDEKRGSITAYAYGIAHFVRLEAIKAIPPEELWSNVVEFEAASATPQPDEQLATQRERARLRQAISKLNEKERQVVGLLIDQDLSLAEIGEILGMPVNTVKSHVHRAKKALQKRLTEPSSSVEGRL